jgi:hypothetical protein
MKWYTEPTPATSYAPNDANYLVTSSDADLTAEVLVSALTANLTITGNDAASRTITLGQQVTNPDIITVDVPLANFTVNGSTLTPDSTTITVSGDTNEITVAEGAQDLSANRTFNVGIADDAIFPGTGAVEVPTGTTAQRPTPSPGQFRVNSTTERVEYVDGESAALFEDLSKVYDIRRFGAAIDGSTDDTTAWNNAIIQCNADGGGIVWHPGGNSVVDTTILWLAGVKLAGPGGTRGAVAQITHNAGSALPLISGLVDPGVSSYTEYTCIEGLTLSGHLTNTTYLIDLLKPAHTYIRYCHLEDCATAAIRLRSGIHTHIDFIRIDAGSTTGYNIHLDTQVDFVGTTLTVTNSTLREGSWILRSEADAYNRVYFDNNKYESCDKGIAQIEEGASSARAHFFFDGVDGENIDNSDSGVAAFQVGTGTGSNAVYFHIDRFHIEGSDGTNNRVAFALERCFAFIGNGYLNRFYDGIISTTSDTATVSFEGHIEHRSNEHGIYGTIDDFGDINFDGSIGSHSTSEKLVQEFVSTASGSTVDTTFSLPQEVVPTRVHFHVKDAITGATTWDADFITGLTHNLVSAGAIAEDTAIGKLITGQPRPTGTLNIRLTANGSSFTGGVIVVTLWYLDIADRASSIACLQLPHSAAPSLSHSGDIALDETVTGFTNGFVRYYDDTGTQMMCVALTVADFEAATDTYVLSYNGTNQDWELVANGSGATEWTETAGVLHPDTATDDVAIGGTDSTAPFYFDESAAILYLQGVQKPRINILNPTASSDQYAEALLVGDDGDTNKALLMRSYGGTYSSSGPQKALSAMIASHSSNSAGLNLVSANTSTPVIRFYVGGFDDNDEAAQIDATGRLELAQQARSVAAWGTNGVILNTLATTYTDSSTASMGTAASAYFVTLNDPTLAASNTLVTTTDVGTMKIGVPQVGANQTFTNTWSLVLDGNLKVGNELHWPVAGQSIVSDAGGLTYNVPTSDVHELAVNGTAQLTVTATQINCEGNTIVSANFSAGAIDAITELDSSIRTGSDTKVVTGTAGSNQYVGYWNSDGDLIGNDGLQFNDSASLPSLTVEGSTNAYVYVKDGSVTGVMTLGAAGTFLGSESNHAAHLMVNNAAMLQVDGNATAGNTRLLIWDVDTGALARVSVGADDSGGTGFKYLRIPN